ncbi:Fe2+-dependent dioxygenase [Roseiterribacter gracilis]|uniref:PKHD-type hydroxylase n=1 Tax=Roseiterribacter gracilis TaxID=2812848 RepID=A0A8S8XCV2_9PROT|nr:PKHD-type hydroxylase [Rhodospirillales bacterium TMPK1]
MILCLDEVVSPAELRDAQAALVKLPFADGKSSAGWHASGVKANEQADAKNPGVQKLVQRLADRIASHPIFAAASLPAAFGPVMINRYRTGARYGRHVDDALMRAGTMRRSDLSFTLFLSDPESYDGGALLMHTAAGDETYRLPAGSMLLYPSTSLHSVEEVTRGERLAAVGWVQSLVRDPGQREILFDLDRARRAVFDKDGHSEPFELLAKSYANLLRSWAEPI